MNQSESKKCIIRLQYSDNKPCADTFDWLVFGRDCHGEGIIGGSYMFQSCLDFRYTGRDGASENF